MPRHFGRGSDTVEVNDERNNTGWAGAQARAVMKPRTKKLAPFVPLTKGTMKTPAWKAMSHGARSLYAALKGRYNTKLQNSVYLAGRDATEELGSFSRRDNVRRWFRELEYYGFIRMVRLASDDLAKGGQFFPTRLEHRGALEIAFKNPDPQRFPFTLALATLLVLTERPGHDQIFDIMRDFLLMMEIPSSDIDYHATVGLWRTKWRNDKIGEAARLAVSEAWREREDAEKIEAANAKTLRNTIARAHEKLEEMVRADPELRDFTIGRAVIHGSPSCTLGNIIDLYGSEEHNGPRDDAKVRAEELREIFDGLAGKTCRVAAEELNRRGIKTAHGGRWYPSQVSRVRARLRKK
jgi:hypothetical protein